MTIIIPSHGEDVHPNITHIMILLLQQFSCKNKYGYPKKIEIFMINIHAFCGESTSNCQKALILHEVEVSAIYTILK